MWMKLGPGILPGILSVLPLLSHADRMPGEPSGCHQPEAGTSLERSRSGRLIATCYRSRMATRSMRRRYESHFVHLSIQCRHVTR